MGPIQAPWKGEKKGYELFKTSLWFRSEYPVLRPFTAVNIPLRVVVPDGLLFGDVILIVGSTSTLGRR